MSDFFDLRNETVTVRASARRRVVPSSLPLEGRQRIVVQGRLPAGGRAILAWASSQAESPLSEYGEFAFRFED